eukprot:CAMPEP_0182562340 /NCGR_PEP_ID=MMETSP1324-20130603/4705_1 /TAXON_ID=236786 /ORGANISM="Florenciella sp., Strain RCC1587" /LENGTH=55 /DNA_ID=CAMNT_0024775269 /DNA_START=65 /DNA_END=229 /DNA_ORIENTATION=+
MHPPAPARARRHPVRQMRVGLSSPSTGEPQRRSHQPPPHHPNRPGRAAREPPAIK